MKNVPPEKAKELVEAAFLVRKKAYAPYSHYSVGSALLTEEGEIVTGCNVENSSYGLTICAERNAVFKAVSEGHKKFLALAIVTRNGAMPCGACRQVLNEFGPFMTVIVAGENQDIIVSTTLDKLLPEAFGPSDVFKK